MSCVAVGMEDPQEPPTPRAAEPDEEAPKVPTDVDEAPDEVLEMLEQSAEEQPGLFQYGPVTLIAEPWRKLRKELSESYRLDLGIAYTTLYQHASSTVRGPRDAWAGDFDLFGTWHAVGRREQDAGGLAFLVEQRHTFTSNDSAELSVNMGSLWSVGGFSGGPYLAVAQLYWEQHLFDDRFIIRAGKLDHTNYYQLNRIGSSANRRFVNSGINGNPTNPTRRNAIGANLELRVASWLTLSAGFGDANGSKTSSGFSTIGDGELFGVGEIRLHPKLEGIGVGRYRFTVWHIDAREDPGIPSDTGFALSFDQDIVENVIAFVKYGYADVGVQRTKEILSAGVGIYDPFGLDEDNLLGIGFAWGEPTLDSSRDQWTTEVFYRFRLSPVTELTPSLQFVVDPSLNPSDDLVAVFGLRWRMAF